MLNYGRWRVVLIRRKKKVMYKKCAAWLCWFLVSATAVSGPSFDCSKARSDSEKLICADSDLSALDNELNQIYRKAKEAAFDKKQFRNDAVMEWKWRDKNCHEKSCLMRWYAKRKQELLAPEIANGKYDGSAASIATNAMRDEGRQSADDIRLKYISNFRKKYSASIYSEDAEAYRIVSGFDIDCKLQDRRFLPLLHVLYATAGEAEGMGGELKFYLQRRVGEVRIYSELRNNGKMLREPTLNYQINDWGELRPVGISAEALLNGCIGSYGPIWLFPGEVGG